MHLKEGVVAGVLLGDGYLDSAQARIRFQHTLPQLNYLQFKLGLMEQLGFSTRCFSLTKVRTNVGLYDYCSGTASGNNVAAYYGRSLDRLLYDLNPLGLLLWWLDDGSLSVHQKSNGSISRFGYLNTQGFDLEGNQLIGRALHEKFGLETNVHVDSKTGFAKSDHYRIYLNATNMRRLIDLVREFIPWIPTNMRYKLNMQYVHNRVRDSEIFAAQYNF